MPEVLAAPCMISVVEKSLEPEDMTDLRELAISSAKKLMARDGHVEPVILFLGKDPKSSLTEKYIYGIMQLGQFMQNDDTKDVLAEVLPQILGGNEAFVVCFISEVWIAVGEKTDEEYERRGSVKDMPGSEEAVIIHYETVLEKEVHLFRINREGDVPELIERKDVPEMLSATGRFASFLGKVPEEVLQ